MKKFLSICIALVLLVSLIGCSDISSTTGKESPSKGKGKSGTVELSLLTHYSAQQEKELKKYIDMWNKENPKIQVKHKSIADFAQLLPTIMAQQTSGQTSDIVHVYSLWGGQLAKSNVLAQPPKDVLDDITQNYADSAIKGSTVDGKVLGYPTEVQTYALFYNKKLLSEAGFDNPPKTWDELKEMSKKITKKDKKGKVLKEGFGLTSGWDSAVVHPYLSLMETAGGSFLNKDNTKAELSSEAGKKTLDFEQSLIQEGVTDPSINVLKAFPSEKVAMTINAGWWNGSLKAAMKDRYKNVGVAPIPSPDGKTQGSVSYSFFYGVNNRSAHKEEAWKFLNWLNSKPLDNKATPESNFLLSQGIIPGRTDDLTALEKDLKTPNNQPFIDALEYATPEPNVLEGQKIKSTLQKEIESVWSGKKKADEAIQSASSQIDQELEK